LVTVRIGFAGAGGVAVTHLVNLLRLQDAEVVAIHDVDADRIAGCVRRVNAQQDLGARSGDETRRLRPKAYTDYRAMIAEAGLNALYICTPPSVRGAIEMAAIEEDVALCVEKPIALRLDRAREIATAIRERNLVSSVCYQVRYSEAVTDAHKALGTRSVAMGLGFMLGGVPSVPWWRVHSQSGGQIVEQATHAVDLMRAFMGEVVRVYGAGALRVHGEMPGFDIHDTAASVLHFANGAVGSLVNTSVLGGGSAAGFPTGLHLFAADYRIEVWGGTLKVVSPDKTDETRYNASPMLALDTDFVDAVKRRDPARVRTSYGDALRTLAVTLALDESARSGKVTEVPRV
ncbi:MAG: gfo/Idh/MocA family oxidoreductase, partial [Proteobacteria bacterium]|nr:gfo/Idh/MocA family oxidoreductase [Pseudomonadota bacterium]